MFQASRAENDWEQGRAKVDLEKCETKAETIEERLARVEEEREQDRERGMEVERRLAYLEDSRRAVANMGKRTALLLAGIFVAWGILYFGYLGYNRWSRTSLDPEERLSAAVGRILADWKAEQARQQRASRGRH
ncbi:hypothetical protein BDN72DRAFT_284026 [Pluteus cervinus]|uniref:Uncharacterized protein n=1 Tax=Pluteus cervinus TaxID=181527 RepID=A0ACD3B4E6_9AGAR|nr:hypothetical protein BDN72DRAFT_284026 [Pluteus cervinus]